MVMVIVIDKKFFEIFLIFYRNFRVYLFPFLIFLLLQTKKKHKICAIHAFWVALHCVSSSCFLFFFFLSCWLSFILMDMPQPWHGMEWQRDVIIFYFSFHMLRCVLVQQYPNVTFRFHFNCSILWISKNHVK